MGDFRACESSAAAAVSDPDPPSISREIWDKAEERTDEILCRIRPTVSSDRNRRKVFEYVRGLITGSLGCEVLPYGSVPLKTYLPDGDIDLTAISTPNIENTLFSDVYAVLKGEEHNRYACFEVKDVHYINAEVKLVKCLVQNIVIDISFNQLGGLCTLHFLEKVDGLIGKDHLFKRSIILIKAWCYYESRILGAHHGLISTYALETLVLHVFHLFHSSLNGPLAVLYRFLDYFSKFDWENYCVSLSRPVCKSSLPDVLAKQPENGRDDLLLSEEFLQDCVDRFSAPSKGIETNAQAFPQKHLNIIDALKENNNLGRSVNRGNFYRIRSAFKYGACKLGQILSLPRGRLEDELDHFFANTLERHTIGATDAERSDTCQEDSMFLKSTAGHHNDLMLGFKSDEKKQSSEMVFSQALPEMKCTSERNFVSENNRSMDAKGILSSRSGHKLSNMLSASSDLRTSFLGEESNSAPHCNGKIEIRNPYGRMPAKSAARDDTSFAHRPESMEESLAASNSIGSYGNNENVAPRLALSIPALNMSENSSSNVRERNSAGNLGNSAPLKSLLDPRGHYESYFSRLIYSKHYHFDAADLPSPVSNQLYSKSIWESTQQQSPWLERRLCSDMKENGGLGPQSYPVNPPVLSNASVSSEEQKNSRGTGTYFPKVNYNSNRDQPSSHRGRFPAPGAHGQLQRHAIKSSLVTVPTEMNLSGEVSHELSQEEYPVLGNATSSDFHRLFPSVWCSLNASDPSHSSETRESRYNHLKLREVSLPEESSSPSSDTCSWDSTSSLVVPTVQSPDEDRVVEQSFHLKNEVDFPPLSLGRMVKT